MRQSPRAGEDAGACGLGGIERDRPQADGTPWKSAFVLPIFIRQESSISNLDTLFGQFQQPSDLLARRIEAHRVGHFRSQNGDDGFPLARTGLVRIEHLQRLDPSGYDRVGRE
jgi:hypothetical protein